MTLSEIREEYISQLPLLKNWGLFLSSALGQLPSKVKGITTISWRVKEWNAIKAKFETKRTVTQLSDIKDLIGVRIIVSNNSDIETLLNEVFKLFAVVEHSERVIKSSGIFYTVIKAKEKSKYTAKFSGLVAEFQIMTVEQDAKLRINHELSYANKSTSIFKIDSGAAIGLLRLEKVVSEFETLISSKSIHEKKDIHPFLVKNPFLVHNSSSEITSEVQIGLGKEYQIDFLVRMPDTTYFLVEIENSTHKLFTKQGDFSAPVNHAVRQVEDWQEWIENNLSTVHTKYPGLISPEGIVVIGRSVNLSPEEKKKLARRNINSRGKIKIITYDNLLSNAKTYIESIKQNLFQNIA